MTLVADIDLHLALAAVAKRPAPAGSAPKLRREAISLVAAEGLATPAFAYRTTALQNVSGVLFDFGDQQLHAPGLTAVAAGLNAVASVVCTLGPVLEERVSELCNKRRLSLAFALDAVGNELLFYTARRASLAVRGDARAHGWTSGDPLVPGGNGLPLDQQGAVVALAGGAQLGVGVTAQGMLYPVKSRSMVIGVGTGLTAKPLLRRCESCSSRGTCVYRAQ
jgi:hypothetical protein